MPIRLSCHTLRLSGAYGRGVTAHSSSATRGAGHSPAPISTSLNAARIAALPARDESSDKPSHIQRSTDREPFVVVQGESGKGTLGTEVVQGLDMIDASD